MDALSEILHAVKLEGAVFYNAELTAPWGVRSPAADQVAEFLGKGGRHLITFHLLTGGRACTKVEDGTQVVELIAGDIVVFPHGNPHILSNGSPTRIVEQFTQPGDGRHGFDAHADESRAAKHDEHRQRRAKRRRQR